MKPLSLAGLGKTVVTLKIVRPIGRKEIEALVDTGATYAKIPRSLALELGIIASYSVEVELRDGRRISRAVGLADIEMEGVRRLIPISLGDEGETPVLGYTALELLGFSVNPVTGRLERAFAIEYVMARD